MSKIIRLQADNFKRLVAIDIHPGGGVVPIRGRNAQGKSSTLDAIMAGLGGKSVMPSRPVRTGEDEGAIRIELDDGAVILRRFTSDGKGDTIEVTNGEGFRAPSPQKMLDGLYASVAFDPLAFTRLHAKDQLAQLRRLVKLDVDIDALEAKNKVDYDARRDKNREQSTEAARLVQMPIYLEAPKQKIDEAAIEAIIASAAETNGQIERRRVNREEFARAIERNELILAERIMEIADLEQQLAAARSNMTELETLLTDQKKQLAEAPELPEPVDVTQAQADLREARETNRKIDAHAAHVAQEARVKSLGEESDRLTKAMDERKVTIAKAIAAADMPVPGLGFGDGEVLFNELPLDQASSAEQLRVSTAIGMATSPKLRVMLVRDGSLLDDDGERILAEMAEANDFQLWVEAVDTSGNVGIVIEDGAVVSIDGEPAPEPEAIAKPKRRGSKKSEEPAAEPKVFELGAGTITSNVEGFELLKGEALREAAADAGIIDPDAGDGDVLPEADRDPSALDEDDPYQSAPWEEEADRQHDERRDDEVVHRATATALPSLFD